ncbi:g9817 [Coccomyxa elongata]
MVLHYSRLHYLQRGLCSSSLKTCTLLADKERRQHSHRHVFVGSGRRSCGPPRVFAVSTQTTQKEEQRESPDQAELSHAQMADRMKAHAESSSSGRESRWDPTRRRGNEVAEMANAASLHVPQPVFRKGHDLRMVLLGAGLALCAHYVLQWLGHMPWWQRISRRFIWWHADAPPHSPYGAYAGEPDTTTTAMVLYSDNEEAVEWVNMCWRKMWRVYQRGLERWIADLLQPVFDNLVTDGMVPRFVQRLRILEFTIDHEAPYFSKMRRRTSRKDSDLNGIVDVRYTGGARMLLLIEVGQGRWRFKLPVLVSDLDLECKMWIKLRLAPMCPYIGSISLAFVGAPNVKVQLLPYNRVRVMRIPILQAFLTKLFTVDLPGLIVLPKRLDINIPPAVTAVAEAAVGRDAVMRAVASAVLQSEALEHSLMAALPLGPQSAAGGVSLPDSFHGELTVTLLEARNLPVWGFPWQSNPYCRLEVGDQSFRSRRDDDTSHAGSHRAPVWNQEFQFLVEDPITQVVTIRICDSHITGRPDVGYVKFPLVRMPADGRTTAWLPVQSSIPGQRGQGELHVQLIYKPFEDEEEETDNVYQQAEAFAASVQGETITDVRSAADASSRAAVAASAAAAAVAVTKAAAARAAAKVRKRAGKEHAGQGGNGARPDWSKDNGARPRKRRESGNGARPRGVWEIMDSLKDITPEDLFPGVAYSITEDDGDEDMPYTRPVRPRPKESNGEVTVDKAADAAMGDIQRRIVERVPSIGRGQILSAEDAPARIDAGIELELGPASDDRVPMRTWPEQVDPVHGRAGLSTSGPGSSRGFGGHESDGSEEDDQQSDDGGLSTITEETASAADAATADAHSVSHQQPAGGSLTSTEGSPEESRGTKDEAQSEGGWLGYIKRLSPWKPKDETVGQEEPLATEQAKSAEGDVGEESAVADEQGQIKKSWWSWLPWTSSTDDASVEDIKEAARRREAEMEELMVPNDLPIEMIAEEVKESWRLKEVHVEKLMQKAVEQSERPWLMLLTYMSALSALLLALVFWKLYQMQL